MKNAISLVMISCSLMACTTTQTTPQVMPQIEQKKETTPQVIHQDGIVITPYDTTEIQRQSLGLSPANTK